MHMQKHILSLLFLALLTQLCTAIEVQVSTYPECVQPGDTYYVKITFVNDSDENYLFVEPPIVFGGLAKNRFNLSRNGNVYYWFPEVVFWVHPDLKLTDKYLIPPKSQSFHLLWAFQFPSLEDLHSEFWEREMEALKNSPEGLEYEFEMVVHRPRLESPQTDSIWGEIFRKDIRTLDREEEKKRLAELWEKLRLRLMTKVKIKLRPPDEMTLIEQWYQNTPESLWPKIAKYTAPLPGCKETGTMQYIGRHSESKNWIAFEEEQLSHWGCKVSPWHFVRLGNRYPSDPNAPETWQGWKELEESISPSTMRDEIRLTRIFIQYCTTKDKKVIEELEEWFAEMNEVQRAHMAMMIFYRTKSLVFPTLFLDLYRAIHKYNISVKTDAGIEWLKKLELLE